ncbi:ribonuclease H2 subunit C-like [Mangifera indica]|uniref:ribonuclease H2 subunit C-like n=1 Tax=Mangifera indica TaxID=29780 RepID=UPI001CFBDE19|nr:ribonuclease H2 subunit C-like [Mangifera indica]XP_044495902.1 ribonuclease H2 subunit C-like [Mangifera indica]XP_044495903.1 ribonuclease H2 subunit C-like [Mangifera indica]
MMEEDREDSSLGFINLTPNNGDESLVVTLSGQVHQLPCCIKYDGPCPVSHYFKPKPTGIEVDGLKVEEAHFRGRKLQGVTISLPDGYSGFVLGKKNSAKRKISDTSGENLTCWETKAKFDKLTYWNHDTCPTKDDAFLRSFHWFSVAEALHRPVTAEDLVSSSITLKKS